MKTLVRGGTVVSLDPDVGTLPTGDVLFDNGLIAAVAGDLGLVDAEVVDATGFIVMPGFVDTHRHTWQTTFRGMGADWTFDQYRIAMHGTIRPHYRPDDVYLANLLGRLEALDAGVTTMVDWFHCADRPENADAAVDALQAVPGHSIFCYGAGARGDAPIAAEVRRVRRRLTGDDMVLGLRGPQLSSLDTTVTDVELARELDLPVSVHIHVHPGEGRPIATMNDRGLLDSRTTVVHGNGIADDEVAMMAAAGCSVSISPDVEIKMGFGWPETGRMLAAGIRPSLSVDDTPSAAGDLFGAMRTALAADRGQHGDLSTRELLNAATVDGAHTIGRHDRTGSITVGKDADVILLDATDPTMFPVSDPVGTIVSAGHPGVVDTVFVAGRMVKRDGRLLGVDLPARRAELLASRDRIAAAAGIAVDGFWVPAA